MRARLKDLVQTRDGDYILTLVTREDLRILWDELNAAEVAVTVKKHSARRSLDANGYAWHLMSRIAEAVRTTKEAVYEDMLRAYGEVETYTDAQGRECAVLFSLLDGIDPSRVAKHYAEIGSSANGKQFTHYRVIKGSSEYTAREVRAFLDGVVYEAKQMGIETATEAELTRYVDDWRAKTEPKLKNEEEKSL